MPFVQLDQVPIGVNPIGWTVAGLMHQDVLAVIEVIAALDHQAWRFLGIDPAQPMLEVVKERIATSGLSNRMSLVQQFVGDLPLDTRYDGATAAMLGRSPLFL